MFVAQTETLYGKEAMTFNVHQILHLAVNVRDRGPLWSHSDFPFESGNGKLVKKIYAARGEYTIKLYVLFNCREVLPKLKNKYR